MSLPVVLSPEALLFWKSTITEIREPFRAAVVADVHLRATIEGVSVEIRADLCGHPLEVVHPWLELEPCPGCSSNPCQCPVLRSCPGCDSPSDPRTWTQLTHEGQTRDVCQACHADQDQQESVEHVRRPPEAIQARDRARFIASLYGEEI
jgi:hypothetical protein